MALPVSPKAEASRFGLLFVIGIYCLMPFVWLLVAAFDPDAGLFLEVPKTINLNNFYRVFAVEDGFRWLVNSLIVCGGATAIVLVLAGFGGYGLSRSRAWWKRPFLYSIILIRVIPPPALIVPLYQVMLAANKSVQWIVKGIVPTEYYRPTMRIVGFIDGYLGLILLMSALHLPLALWIMKTFFDTVSREYEEAAVMDGATFTQRLRRVLIPLAMPGLAASGLFAFIACWDDFLVPLTFISSPELRMLPLGIFSAFLRDNLIDYGLLAAIAVIYTIPAVAAFVLARRFLVQTFSGGLKG